jgi:Mce-associated membrane protein
MPDPDGTAPEPEDAAPPETPHPEAQEADGDDPHPGPGTADGGGDPRSESATPGTDAEEPDTEEPDAAPAPPRKPVPRGVRVLAGAAVVVALVGGGFQVAAAHLRGGEVLRNRALVDTTDSTQVVGDVTSGLNAVLSYSYGDTSSPQAAARRILTGSAARQYTRLISVVRKQAPKEHIVLRSNVITAAPVTLTEDRAELLVFLDQSARRGRTGKVSNVAAQLLITAQRQGDQWIISNIALR